MMMNGCGGGMLLWSLLLLVLIVGGIWLAVRPLRGTAGSSTAGAPSARQILEERFVRGEIDRDQVEERRRTLGD